MPTSTAALHQPDRSLGPSRARLLSIQSANLEEPSSAAPPEASIPELPNPPDPAQAKVPYPGEKSDGLSALNPIQPTAYERPINADTEHLRQNDPLKFLSSRVAINSGAFNLDKIDVMQALFGQEVFLDVGGEFEMRREPNGVWNGPEGVRYTRISGVWVFNDLKPSNIASRKHAVYMNPFAQMSVPDFLLDVPSHRPEGDKLVEKGGLCIRCIFDMPQEWPESSEQDI